SLKHLDRFFGRGSAAEIAPDRVDAYICARKDEGAAAGTIQKELAALKRMFSLAERAGKLPRSPRFPSIDVRNVPTGFLQDPDLRSVLETLPEHLRAVVLFGYYTGWRKGEVIRLTWAAVDFVGGVVRLEPGTTKNDEAREFPFGVHAELAEVLRLQREETSA